MLHFKPMAAPTWATLNYTKISILSNPSLGGIWTQKAWTLGFSFLVQPGKLTAEFYVIFNSYTRFWQNQKLLWPHNSIKSSSPESMTICVDMSRVLTRNLDEFSIAKDHEDIRLYVPFYSFVTFFTFHLVYFFFFFWKGLILLAFSNEMSSISLRIQVHRVKVHSIPNQNN